MCEAHPCTDEPDGPSVAPMLRPFSCFVVALEDGASSEFRQEKRRPPLIVLVLGAEFQLKLIFLD